MASSRENKKQSNNNGDDPILIFTYGTLKRDFPNHNLMQTLIESGDAVFQGEYTTIEPYPLLIGPHGIPYLINLPGSGLRVRGELYSVTNRGLGPLDQLEGVEIGHYERLPLKLEAEAEAYFAHRSFGEGLWRRCGGVGAGEFTMEMAGRYRRKENRGPNSDYLNDLKIFISSVDD